MKKNIFKFSLILSSICALFSLCLFVKPNKSVLVSADGAVPDNVLPNAVDYYVYSDMVGMFDYSWNFTTYDNDSSYEEEEEISIQYGRIPNMGTVFQSVKGKYYRLTGNSWYYPVQMTAYVNGYWGSPTGIHEFSELRIRSSYCYVYSSGQGELPINSGSGYLLFVTDITSVSNNQAPSSFIQILATNGDFYYIDNIDDIIDERDGDVVDYNILVNEFNSLLSLNEDIYYVNVYVHYEIIMDFYMRTSGSDGTQYFIKPKTINFLTTVEMFNYDASDYVVSYDIVDTLDLTNITYYYAYPSLSNYLVVRADDLNYLYLEYYDNNTAQVYSLNTANSYIDSLKKDNVHYGIGTDTSYFRKQVNYMFSLVSASYVDYVNNYYQGVEDGYINGFTAGKTEGYSLGVAEGYEDGMSVNPTVATIFSGILQIAMVPVNFFLGIFNFEILGINMASFVSALLTVAITIIIIRIVTGKKND